MARDPRGQHRMYRTAGVDFLRPALAPSRFETRNPYAARAGHPAAIHLRLARQILRRGQIPGLDRPA